MEHLRLMAYLKHELQFQPQEDNTPLSSGNLDLTLTAESRVEGEEQ